jgi:hypothetical protein
MLNAKNALEIQRKARRQAERERQRKINMELEKIDRAILDRSERGFRNLEHTVPDAKYIEPLIFILQNEENKFIAKKTHSVGILIEW